MNHWSISLWTEQRLVASSYGCAAHRNCWQKVTWRLDSSGEVSGKCLSDCWSLRDVFLSLHSGRQWLILLSLLKGNIRILGALQSMIKRQASSPHTAFVHSFCAGCCCRRRSCSDTLRRSLLYTVEHFQMFLNDYMFCRIGPTFPQSHLLRSPLNCNLDEFQMLSLGNIYIKKTSSRTSP